MWMENTVGSMTGRVGSKKMAFHGAMLMVVWSFMPLILSAAYAQPNESVPATGVPAGGIDSECRVALEKLPCKGIEPGSGRLRTCYENNKGQLTPSCRQQVQERPSEAAALMVMPAAAAATATPGTDAAPIVEHKRVRPSETYVAGFGGYTFGGKLSNLEGPGLLPGGNGGDRDLADSAVYGGKVGHFFGDRMDWLGVEMEAFNTTPHVEQQGLTPGAHLRVTTLAFNLIGRLKFGCETKAVRTEPRTEGAKRYETHYEREFCRVQPYGGVGLGVFFANLSNNGTSASDNAVPGLNALAGLRYYFNERVALFGEYKYNRAALDLTNGPIGGLNGDYQANHLVGGLSFHF